MLSDPGQALVWMVPLLLLAGSIAGMLAGLLGVGGGIIIVPALFYIFGYFDVEPDVKMHLAVGTSLATIIPTSIRSMRAHNKRGSFDAVLFRDWLVPMAGGVLLGSWLASMATTFMLTVLFGCVALMVSAQLALGRSDFRLSNAPPRGAIKYALAAFIGAVASMMGIGGGSLSVPAMSLFGTPMHRAVGTSAGFGLIIAVAGTIGFILMGWGLETLPPYSSGFVNWLAFISIVPVTVAFVPLGAKLAHSMSQKALKRAFAILLAITAVRMLSEAAGL